MKIVEVVGSLNIGGIETLLVNICKNVDLKNNEIIFITYYDMHFDYEDTLKELGVKIYKIPNYNNMNSINQIKSIYKILKKERPSVVHAHTYFNSLMAMIAAVLAKVKVRVVHAHTAFIKKEKLAYKIVRLLFSILCTKKLACSKEAGKVLFGNKFEIISNGIDFNKFYYNENLRKKYRRDFNIKDNEIVIGHVGRIDTPKNHKFLLDIFNEILKTNNNYKLMLVGEGPLLDEIKTKAKELNIEDKIIFTLNRSDVSSLINAFDIVVFPSIYEGLPISLVEAQVNGLNILVSNNVSLEIKLSSSIHFYSLEEGTIKWADKIIKMDKNRIDTKEDMLKSGYDIKMVVAKLMEIYGDQNE